MKKLVLFNSNSSDESHPFGVLARLDGIRSVHILTSKTNTKLIPDSLREEVNFSFFQFLLVVTLEILLAKNKTKILTNLNGIPNAQEFYHVAKMSRI